jgi:hypothetical protein
LNKSKQQFEVFVGFPISTICTFVLLCTMLKKKCQLYIFCVIEEEKGERRRRRKKERRKKRRRRRQRRRDDEEEEGRRRIICFLLN